ncbi:MAG: discoidin domain-containing protein [Alphaproteobacteria bacterium]|nr:discoidin domain-containing protein [Alphaproteobacteria bacterium]
MATAWVRGLALAALCLPAVASAASTKASSELEERDGTKHPASLAFDGLLTTAWAESEAGTGEGSWLRLDLDRATEVRSISIWPGDLRRGQRSLRENGRPHTVTVQLLDGKDVVAEQEVRVRDGAEHGPQRIDVPLQGTARAVQLRIDKAYAGYVYNDTYITEVALNLVDGPQADTSRLQGWLASKAGVAAAQKQEEAAIELFGRISTAELGDREALDTLLDWAGDGAPFLRARVASDVPPGFRVAALVPDATAIQALLKLKDPNAIPALERAALRSVGAEQAKLEAYVSYYEAFGELKGGGRRSLPLWGTEGWERGALRSFGEPMGVGLGEDGSIYVADVANHRIQVFSPEGTVLREIGLGKPGITDAWFQGRRRHYVAGKEPSTKEGGFSTPLDLDVIKGSAGDELLVIDAQGRIQWMDAEGRVLKAWKVRGELAPVPGVGGAAHLRLVKKNVVVFWGNEAIVFDLEGNETGRWTVDAGAPLSVLVQRNGRLVLGFRSEAANYGLDGYRYGTVLTEDDLPLGREAWDMVYDDRGKLWVVTDNGWAVKFKAPGREDYRVRWIDIGVVCPRAAVRDDQLTVVASGKVHRVDALQTRLDAEAAAAEAE